MYKLKLININEKNFIYLEFRNDYLLIFHDN